MARVEEINTNYSDKENENINNDTSSESVEKKLGDLLMRGWKMLAESCPKECKYYLFNKSM
jgi:uncharacterized Zn finger protein (UPF0148 family)